ncbi:hypothetical protein [Candidatus Tisiphia endosymbiont of Oplodontha viridula]|uniref:hypothetical protein n=1 Tax=Candidatus Tisiphia endosymbiont of Oplodontha viridula TaxID=3077925 RepID=UPI0035C8D190
MAFKSYRKNSPASLLGATLVATKQSNECGLPQPLRGFANSVLYFSAIFKLSWGLCHNC